MTQSSSLAYSAKLLFLSAIIVAILSIPMTVIWETNFPGKVYFCTDDTGLGYLQPGNWIHGPPEIVDDIQSTISRPMSEPDAILKSWTTRRLWLIWSMMFGSSVLLSLLIAIRALSTKARQA